MSNTMFVVAQIFGVLGMISSILSMQFKDRKQIFVTLLFLNLFSALNFICLGRPSGGAIELFGIVELIVNNQFERRNQKVPIPIIAAYIVITIGIGIATASAAIDAIIITAAIGYCFTILLKNEQKIRLLWMVVLAAYVIYDLLTGAYVFAASSFLSIISTLLAYLRFRKNV